MIELRIKFNNTQELLDFEKFFTNELVRKTSPFGFCRLPSKVYRLKNGQLKVFFELSYYWEIEKIAQYEREIEELRSKGHHKKRGRKPKYAKIS